MEIKIVVVKLDIHDEKDQQKAMKAVSSLTGINSLEVNLNESKMTVTGEVDPVAVVGKLRKYWNTHILTVSPPPPPPEEKKDGDKKDDDKKDGDKKDGDKKEDDKKDSKDQPPVVPIAYPYPYPYPNPHSYPYPHSYPQRPPMYCFQTIEENPNACVIC